MVLKCTKDIENGYDKKFLNKFDTVFSGHFHKKSDDGHVYYLGNTYQMTWSDDGCSKGFHIFDTETRELERIVNPYTIFEKVYYDDTTTNYNDFDILTLKEKFVKIVVVTKKTCINSIDSLIKSFLILGSMR